MESGGSPAASSPGATAGGTGAPSGRRDPQLWRDPKNSSSLAALILLLLMALALSLRYAIGLEGVLDGDAINLGAAALRFSLIDSQPHAPGYPGYVLLLKLIHLLAPGIDPLDIAKWGSRLCGVAAVPAAYWACQQLLASSHPALTAPERMVRSLFAALFATFHPVLWYYGSDGQSHASEALATVLLFGATMRVKRVPTPGRCLALVAAFGLAGSLRPTIPMLSSLLLVWLFWGRPARDWLLAFIVGAASVAVWYVPLVQLSGGWDVYSRLNHSLIYEMFISNYSVFGQRATWTSVLANLNLAFYSLVLCLIPLAAWGRADGQRAWRPGWVAVVLLNTAFYALVYTAEAGYFAAVAALACLVPATWPSDPTPGFRARAIATLVVCPAFFLTAPGTLPGIGIRGEVILPTLARVASIQRDVAYFRQVTCEAAGQAPAFAITDNPIAVHARLAPWACQDVQTGIILRHHPLNPALDNWLLFDRLSMISLPTGIPLEPGPPAQATLPRPVAKVMVMANASKELVLEVRDQATCTPISGSPLNPPPHWPVVPIVWPAACVPVLHLGQNVVHVPVVTP